MSKRFYCNVNITGGTIVTGNSNTLGNLYTTGGNVGIGTTSPGSTLDVNGTARITTSITTGAVNATNITTTNIVSTNVSSSTINATNLTSTNIVGTNISSASIVATTSISSASINGTNMTATNMVGTNVSGGTISGTTYTGGSMSLSGNLTIAGTLTTVNITTTNISETNVSAGTVNANNINVTTQTVGTSRITSNLLALGNSNTIGNIFTTGGNVGISTTAPVYSLDVRGSGNTTATLAFHHGTNDVPYVGLGYNQTADGLGFYYNNGSQVLNTTSMFINRSGSVGIGTTSPAYTLDVNGTGRIATSLTSGALYATNITATNIVGTTVSGATVVATTYTGANLSISGSVSSSNIYFSGTLYQNGVPFVSSSQWTGTTGSLIYYGSTGSVNVGIGTTSPAYTLDVNGTGRIATSLTSGALYATNITATNIVGTTVSGATVVATTYTGANLSISGSTTSANAVITTSLTSGALYATNITGTNIVGTTVSGATVVATTYTGGSMSLSSNLTIAGTLTTVNITTTNLSDTNISAGTLTATNSNVTTETVSTLRITSNLLALGNSNTLGSLYTTGGNVGIGITAPSYALHVSGSIYATGDLTSFSDRRLKSEIVTIDNALDKVSNLRGVYYTNNSTQKRGLGVVAQELQEVVPEAIVDQSEYLGVAYGNIVGLLIEAIKELESKCEQLQNEITELKK